MKRTNTAVVNTNPEKGKKEILSSREVNTSEKADIIVTVRVKKVKKLNVEA